MAALALGAPGELGAQDPTGRTTVEQRIVPAAGDGFRGLGVGPGEGYVVREQRVGKARPGRAQRRRSLLYLGQLSDFQLADEESPARVEMIDTGPFSAAHRPWEALNPQIDDAMVRQLNTFAGASPVRAGDGSRRAMDFAIDTGDIADSAQLNETEWVRTVIEGGPIQPNSGIDVPAGYPGTGCTPLGPHEGVPSYTGVQDFDDYAEGPAPQFYDPDFPTGAFGDWPAYPGLMDRAQQPFTATGLDVPHYAAFGNHDALVQGNAAANAAYEAIATGCVKPMSPAVADPGTLAAALGALDPAGLLETLVTDPANVALVPPDPKRRFVSKSEYKAIWRDGRQADGHGFGHIDAAEEAASNGAAGYYSWRPRPGLRFIALDTVSEAGVVGPSADGNIDDPQFRWLEDALQRATAADELVVLFSHHAIPSLTADVPDEVAPPCTAPDAHGHDVNPGCDLDPRSSAPIHLGDDLEGLLHRYPHVVAWLAGHSHVNSVEAHPNPSGDGGFWSIRVAAEVDWPQQSRLLELFDNRDGTLSIFGTIVDHASPATAPAPGTAAASMSLPELASVGRTLAHNDPQSGARACGDQSCGEGEPGDRNVELLIADPRRSRGEGGRCANPIRGSARRDRLRGTPRGDHILGRAGGDGIRARAGGDCVRGGRGGDRIQGGKGRDRLSGGRGADRIAGGRGRDALRGGRGHDRIAARDGTRDRISCGLGRDRVVAGRKDRIARNCERVVLVARR